MKLLNTAKVLVLIPVAAMLISCVGIFAKAERGTLPDLLSSEWALSYISSMQLNTDYRPTLALSEDLTASGFAGCNRYRSGVELAATDELMFTAIVTTKRACLNTPMKSEDAYLAALRSVSSWSITRNVLRLMDKDGNTLLKFKRFGANPGPNI
jgi:heat shock protein HslJ